MGRQERKPPIYQFNVAPVDATGPGKLIINTADQTFVFNGEAFEPGKIHYLLYTTLSGPRAVGSPVTANPSGNLHRTGTWTGSFDELTAAPVFEVNSPGASLTATFGGFSYDP